MWDFIGKLIGVSGNTVAAAPAQVTAAVESGRGLFGSIFSIFGSLFSFASSLPGMALIGGSITYLMGGLDGIVPAWASSTKAKEFFSGLWNKLPSASSLLPSGRTTDAAADQLLGTAAVDSKLVAPEQEELRAVFGKIHATGKLTNVQAQLVALGTHFRGDGDQLTRPADKAETARLMLEIAQGLERVTATAGAEETARADAIAHLKARAAAIAPSSR